MSGPHVERPKPAVTAPAAKAMPGRISVLVVDDDPLVASSLADHLGEEGYEAVCAGSGGEALERLAESERDGSAHAAARPIGVMICDAAMPGMTGLELLRRAGAAHPQVAAVMLTGYGTIEAAVEALRAGAVDYLTKPVVDCELRLALERAVRHHLLLSENRSLKQRLDREHALDHVIGSDPRILKIYDLVRAVAPSKTTVLMSGESGTGKSMIAAAIHQLSPRRGKPFIQLSCGSIPETLLESELFGHVKGAFTGAHTDKIGRFLAADGGTIFLDEINSASPGMQLKLLRVLQERRFEPVGSTQTVEVDTRVILATNRPLEGLVARGEFRQDLYYRINVVQVDLPPLRERPGDVVTLAEHFLRQHEGPLGRRFAGFAPEALLALERYSFPGNIRELQNIVERAAVLARTPTIGLDDLPETVTRRGGPNTAVHAAAKPVPAGPPSVRADEPPPQGAAGAASLDDALRAPEREIIHRALVAHGWSRQKTADALGINRTTLYKKMKALGIDASDRAAAGTGEERPAPHPWPHPGDDSRGSPLVPLPSAA